MTVTQMVEIERAAKNAANEAYLHSIMEAVSFSGRMVKVDGGGWKALKKYELDA